MSTRTTPTPDTGSASPDFPGTTVGAAVEVHSDFSDRWVPGFAVAETGDEGFRLRRKSDRLVLPEWFCAEEVRIDRR